MVRRCTQTVGWSAESVLGFTSAVRRRTSVVLACSSGVSRRTVGVRHRTQNGESFHWNGSRLHLNGCAEEPERRERKFRMANCEPVCRQARLTIENLSARSDESEMRRAVRQIK